MNANFLSPTSTSSMKQETTIHIKKKEYAFIFYSCKLPIKINVQRNLLLPLL